MPRTYKPNPDGKRYKKYDKNLMKKAIHEYKSKKTTLKEVAEKYKINKYVLLSSRNVKKQGGQPVLSEDTEENLIQYLNICTHSGYPLDSLNLRFLIKCFLDKLGITVSKFRNNLPGPDFLRNFLKRHRVITSTSV